MNRLTNNENNCRDLYILNVDRKKEQKAYEIPKTRMLPQKLFQPMYYVIQ